MSHILWSTVLHNGRERVHQSIPCLNTVKVETFTRFYISHILQVDMKSTKIKTQRKILHIIHEDTRKLNVCVSPKLYIILQKISRKNFYFYSNQGGVSQRSATSRTKGLLFAKSTNCSQITYCSWLCFTKASRMAANCKYVQLTLRKPVRTRLEFSETDLRTVSGYDQFAVNSSQVEFLLTVRTNILVKHPPG